MPTEEDGVNLSIGRTFKLICALPKILVIGTQSEPICCINRIGFREASRVPEAIAYLYA